MAEEIISPIPPLNPNEETVIHTKWYYDPGDVPVVFTLEAIADNYSTVEELDEDNNRMTKEFTTYRKPKTTPFSSFLIVHAHNPEGREIGSITGFENYVEVFGNGNPIGYSGGAIALAPGHYLIEAKFNGMTQSQEIDLIGTDDEVEITFVFARETINVGDIASMTLSGSNTTTEHQIYPTHGSHAVSVQVNPWMDGIYELWNLAGSANFSWYNDYSYFPFDSAATVGVSVVATPVSIKGSVTGSCDAPAQAGYQGFPTCGAAVYVGYNKITAFTPRSDFDMWYCQYKEPAFGAGEVIGFGIVGGVIGVMGLTPTYAENSPHNFGAYHCTELSTSQDFKYAGWFRSWGSGWYVGLAGGENYNIPLAISFEKTYQVSAGPLVISSVPYAVEDL